MAILHSDDVIECEYIGNHSYQHFKHFLDEENVADGGITANGYIIKICG